MSTMSRKMTTKNALAHNDDVFLVSCSKNRLIQNNEKLNQISPTEIQKQAPVTYCCELKNFN